MIKQLKPGVYAPGFMKYNVTIPNSEKYEVF